MPSGRCRCGAIRYRLKPPVAYTGKCNRSKVREAPLTTLLSVPQAQFRLLRGGDLLEECGHWRLCGQCGATVFYQADGDMVSALACTVEWPGQNVDDLHSAAKYGKPDLRRLIHRGLPLEGEERGETPLAQAAFNGEVRACRILLEHGARPDRAIREAACSYSPAILRLFLEHGVERRTLFHAIVRFGRARDARLLINETTDVNDLCEDGITPLYRAAWNCRSMIRFLLKCGADPNLSNRNGGNAPGLCAFRGLPERLKVLLAAGLTPSTLEEALVSACRGRQRHCFELLVEAGAPVNQANFTPLMAAAQAGSLPLVGRLLELGAEPAALDDEGKSAQDYARHETIRERLAHG